MTGREKDIEGLKTALGHLVVQEMILEAKQRVIGRKKLDIRIKLTQIDPEWLHGEEE
jgi:hypothetical protein